MSDVNSHCLNCNATGLEKDEVVILKCSHSFCCDCLLQYVLTNLNSKIKCPYNNCLVNINDSIIRQTLPDSKIKEYESISLHTIINSDEQCFKCLLPDCENIVFFNNKNIQFECSKCTLFNCISCAGSHPFMSCKDYTQLKESALENEEDLNILKIMENNEFSRAKEKLHQIEQNQIVTNLKRLDSCCVLPNDELFTCLICCKQVSKDTGIKLRNCFHMFCKNCLHGAIINSETIPIRCLDSSCKFDIQDREIRGILSTEEYNIFHDKSLMLARSKLENVFHCKKPDCKYFGICDNADLENFQCPVCKSLNCIKCNAIHQSETCEQYKLHNGVSKLDLMSIEFIEKEIKQGKCMKCPTCGCLIKKTGGCNWIKCPQCKLELCWILKIPRWGPKGNGDITGGCRCGVNNKPCSPLCLVGCIPEQ